MTQHLLVECVFSRTTWEHVLNWWLTPRSDTQILTLKNIWDRFKKSKSKPVKSAWKVVVSATLWSIWLVRNNIIFRSDSVSKEAVLCLIKQFSREWCQSFKILLKPSSKWWNVNPIGSITNTELFQYQGLFHVESDFISFIDGSCKRIGGKIIVGIGGLIMTKTEEQCYSFSDPVSSTNPFDTE